MSGVFSLAAPTDTVVSPAIVSGDIDALGGRLGRSGEEELSLPLSERSTDKRAANSFRVPVELLPSY